MTERAKRLYEEAMKDEDFVRSMKMADGDDIRNELCHNTKVLIAAIYYGWLISWYGESWEDKIK